MTPEPPREVKWAIYILLEYALTNDLPTMQGEVTKNGKTYEVTLTLKEMKDV